MRKLIGVLMLSLFFVGNASAATMVKPDAYQLIVNKFLHDHPEVIAGLPGPLELFKECCADERKADPKAGTAAVNDCYRRWISQTN